MRSPLSFGAAVVMMAALVAAPAGRAGTTKCTPPRAMWMWATEAAGKAVKDKEARKAFLDFCEAPHGVKQARITALYLETYSEERRREFIAAAHRRGIKVEFILGNSKFSAEDVEREKKLLDGVFEYNAKVGVSERFDGIHFDVEPSTATWSQKAYRELLSYARSKIDAYNSGNPHRMTLAADIGFWWPIGGEDATAQYGDAMARCDYVVCMAYRDGAKRQLDAAVAQAQEAKRRGIGFWIGCETGELPGQDHVTYYEEGWGCLEEAMGQIPGLFEKQDLNLAGIAVHHYDSYVSLPKQARANAGQ